MLYLRGEGAATDEPGRGGFARRSGQPGAADGRVDGPKRGGTPWAGGAGSCTNQAEGAIPRAGLVQQGRRGEGKAAAIAGRAGRGRPRRRGGRFSKGAEADSSTGKEKPGRGTVVRGRGRGRPVYVERKLSTAPERGGRAKPAKKGVLGESYPQFRRFRAQKSRRAFARLLFPHFK